MSQTDDVLTLGQVAERLGCQTWRIARLYRRGVLPEPKWAGRFRVVAEADIPGIEAALKAAGYLK